MPVPCTLCSDSRRAEIDASIRSGMSFRGVARAYDVTKDMVGRHARAHCGVGVAARGTIVAAQKRSNRTLQRKLTAITAEPVSLGTPADHLRLHGNRYSQVDEIFQEARAVNDHRLALAADKARGEIAGDAARLQGFEKTASPLIDVHLQVIQQRVASLSDADLQALIRGDASPALVAAVGDTIDGDAA